MQTDSLSACGQDAACATDFHVKDAGIGASRPLSVTDAEWSAHAVPDRFLRFHFLLHHMTVENALRLRLRMAKALIAEPEALEARC